jgi:hypothetical protein
MAAFLSSANDGSAIRRMHLTVIQVATRPERYGPSARFATIPSLPRSSSRNAGNTKQP